MYNPEKTDGDTSWFTHDRFGLFIHWGLYSLPARHEWVKHYEEIHDQKYDRYFRHFDPDLYDPKVWAVAARKAGMKYMVVTTKHHEGFCLWDSALTDYKATNTPCGRDLLVPMVEAFRSEGLRIGFYHSLLDWHHPEFPIDGMHSERNNPDAEEINTKRDIKKYAAYLHGQVDELLTKYGKIDIMWFDFSYRDRGWGGKGKDDWQSEELIQLVRSHYPDIIINDRLDIDQDIKTPEQLQPKEWLKIDGKPVVWEACHTFSGSWGYHRDEATWKSAEQLVQLLINSVACGGNLLMNVGPTARGQLDRRAFDALSVYEEWMALHSRSIYGCTQGEFDAPRDCRFTQNGKRLYLHIFNWPFKHIHLSGLAGKVEYAQLLNDASEIPWIEAGQSIDDGVGILVEEGSIILELPVVKPQVTVPVVEIFLK